MKTTLKKIASVLAFIIGGMAIFAGGKVLLGNDPGYYVINWLPLYNYTAGILTVFITAILIWNNRRFAFAMAVRLIAWAIILTLMFFQQRRNKTA